MNIGPKMQLAVSFVAENPGVSYRAAAHYVSPHPHPERNERLGYDIINRAVAAGLLRIVPRAHGNGRGLEVV
jgi:hypothetical protein